MLSLAHAAPFIVLLALGIALNFARGTRYSSLCRSAFIIWFVGAALAAGLLQHDFWPFSPFPVFTESARQYRAGSWYETRIADADGHESTVDSSPLTASVLNKWFERVFASLPPDHQSAVVRFLLDRQSNRACRNRRILGPLTAPDWLMFSARTPQRPPGSFRVYRATIRDRTLVYELRIR